MRPLLLTRTSAAGRLLRPVAAAGAMPLTLYSAHIADLGTGLRDDHPTALYLALVISSAVFAVLWGRWRGAGPVVAAVAGRARRALPR